MTTMNRIILFKALAVGDQEIEDLTIELVEGTPEFHGPGWEAVYREHYDGQAATLVDALVATLPGATLDRVVYLLLKRSASLHRVRWPQESE